MPGRRSPEEEWLNEPEREGFPEDETRSPFEGDIPPWGQKGYEGVFPMAGKVFYVTAYLLLGPEKLSRSPVPEKSPVLGDAHSVIDVGEIPPGQFGTELIYYPFAAIPVRHEDLDKTGQIVDYLKALISELGVYGKILFEKSYPSSNEVRLENGRWFPVELEQAREYGGVLFVNAYNVNRLYGGAEEGGWWYDTGDPVASVPVREEDPAADMEWKDYLKEKAGWSSKHDRSSVLGHDDFSIQVDEFFGRPFPEETPHYE
jgi:hypothetical protein